MSTPLNPLSRYRTYSYHHVLAVCDSTQTATEIAESGILADYFLNRPPEDRLKTQTTPQKGSYVVLMSGFTDAQFVIQDVRWSTIIAANTPASDSGPLTSTIETDGEMTVLEPYGVRFMNVLANVCDALKSDPVGLVFVLKTFFVGHNDHESQDVIANIRPFMFVPIDIQAKFDETGAVYTIAFVGISNGVGKLPYINEIATAITIAPQRNDTLGTVFSEYLPETIEGLYSANRQKLVEDFKKAGRDVNVETDFRKVKYLFDIDPQYRNYKFGTNETVHTSTEPNAAVLSFTSAPTMEHIINAVMMSSKEVVAECNNEKEKFIFKISSSLESTPTEYVIKFYVHRYKVITVPVEDPQSFTPEPGNVIEFDYIFSGKNIDIKEFDIKMVYGLAFFHTISTNPNIVGQVEDASTNQFDANGPGGAAVGSQSQTSTNASTRTGTPIFLGGQVSNSMYRNKSSPIDTANFQALMARHAAIENVQCKICIAGNPQLLDEMSAMPKDFANRKTETLKSGQTIAPTWMTVPAYVKVNIFMPSTVPGQDFVERFWYDGYYQMLSVDNIFSEGAFTQEIEMFSLPIGSILDKRSDETTPTTTTNATTSTPAASTSQENTPPTVSAKGQTASSRTTLRNRQKVKG